MGFSPLPGRQRLQLMERVRGSPRTTRRRARQHQAIDAVRVTKRELLRDHASKGDADYGNRIDTQRIQECHIAIAHTIAELVDRLLFPELTRS